MSPLKLPRRALLVLRIIGMLVIASFALNAFLNSTSAPAADAAPIPVVYKGTVRNAVLALPQAPERRSGYERDKFVHWTDVDHDSCNTRYEVLISEATRKPTIGKGCYLRGGTWRSYYDHVVTTNPTTFDVDHMVPLAEAWDSGASRWDAATRSRYANDLADPRSLVAVTATSNRTKSDGDPANWMPRYEKCHYVADYVAVKVRWRLSIDPRERAALLRVVNACPTRNIAVRRGAIAAG